MEQQSLHDVLSLSPPESSAIRKGRFLWMDPASQQVYLRDLNSRIKRGFFLSDEILDRVVDEIAPIINDSVDRGLSLTY